MPRKPSLMTAGNIFNEVNICAIREPSKRSWRTYRNCLHTNKDSIASWNYPWIWRQKRRPLIRFSYNKIGFLIKRFTYQAHWEHILRAKYAKFNEMCLWEARYEQVFCAVKHISSKRNTTNQKLRSVCALHPYIIYFIFI